jgi:hypothetical protein
MANFDNLSSTVLLNYQIVYQRSEAAAARMQALSDRLHALQQPDARPAMLSRAQEIFQRTGYSYYLLRQQAVDGLLLACLQHAQHILVTVLHCLAVYNQSCIDTRKMDQVLALPKLPVKFADTVDRIVQTQDPDELLAACEMLLHTTRDLLLAEQRQIQRSETTFPAVFHAGYPELKGALQHVMLACERQDMFALKGPLLSLYHELALGMAHVFTGIRYTGFNSLSEYEQDLVALGFPALLPSVMAGDFTELHRQCRVFDQHLQKFLTEHEVQLNTFATVDELQEYLDI